MCETFELLENPVKFTVPLCGCKAHINTPGKLGKIYNIVVLGMVKICEVGTISSDATLISNRYFVPIMLKVVAFRD
jgi:hypothetical protein